MRWVLIRVSETFHETSRAHNTGWIQPILKPLHNHKIGTDFSPHLEFPLYLRGRTLNDQIAINLSTATQQLTHCFYRFIRCGSILVVYEQTGKTNTVSGMGLNTVIKIGLGKDGFPGFNNVSAEGKRVIQLGLMRPENFLSSVAERLLMANQNDR